LSPAPHPSPLPASGEREGPAKREGEGLTPVVGKFSYIKDPAEILRRSYSLIRAEADLARFPRALKPLALRLAHAAGDSAILGNLSWSKGAVAAGLKALAAGAPILVDAGMVAAGVKLDPSRIICTLHDSETARRAATERTTRSAAAVEAWRPCLPGAVVAIGNAPTALFRLLELLAEEVLPIFAGFRSERGILKKLELEGAVQVRRSDEAVDELAKSGNGKGRHLAGRRPATTANDGTCLLRTTPSRLSRLYTE